MTPKDNTQDEELLARYRRASDTDAAAPSESVRSAILAESRRVADELAKKTQLPFDVSRPAANDARWKMTAYGTVGAALLAALLIAPRFWESRRATEVSNAPAAAPAAPAAKIASTKAAAPARATAPAPKVESIAPSSPDESLQEVVVTRAERKASKESEVESRQYSARAPTPSNSPNVAQNYARAPVANNPPTAAQNYTQAPLSPPPVADSARPSPSLATSTAPPAALSPQVADALAGARGITAGRFSGEVPSMSADRAARTSFVPAPASLQAAAGLGDVKQAASLIDQGAAVDARDENGRTPLMLAVVQGRLEVVRLLLARGADPNAADNAGRTPLQQAREKNLRDVAALLERAGAH